VNTEAERRFHADMVAGAEQLKREIGYNPTRFMQMVGELGSIEAARQLLRGGMPRTVSRRCGNTVGWR